MGWILLSIILADTLYLSPIVVYWTTLLKRKYPFMQYPSSDDLFVYLLIFLTLILFVYLFICLLDYCSEYAHLHPIIMGEAMVPGTRIPAFTFNRFSLRGCLVPLITRG